MWHSSVVKKLTKEDLVAAVKEYDEAIAEAAKTRAKIIARAADEGMPQKDIIDATGYSRETIRRLTREGQEVGHV